MRFWFKIAGLGVVGYLMFCLFPLPTDYNTLMQNESNFERLSCNLVAEISATGTASPATQASLQKAFLQSTLAFAQYDDDLKRLGFG